jgi:polyisoprenoid-binding protein YceI
MSQKYFSKNAQISFFSDTPMEKIEAHSKSAVAVLDTGSGQMEFSVLIKSFHFEKALMEEHFNENYMETPKFPKATFKGKITDMSKVDFGKKGSYNVQVSGDLTMHGVTKKVNTSGILTTDGAGVSCQSEFVVAIADYGIEVPAVVRESIAKNVSIKVSAQLLPLKK